MVWKEGKYGRHTGNTLRSRFANKRTSREGVLKSVTKTSVEDFETTEQRGYVACSLGKRKRWLLPEDLRSSTDLRLFDSDEVELEDSSVVFVERRFHEASNSSKGDCISLYDSRQRKIRRPKGKYAQVKSLFNGRNESIDVLEFVYPYSKGSWPHNKESKRKSPRKKNVCRNRRGQRNADQWLDMHEEEEDNFDNDCFCADDTSEDTAECHSPRDRESFCFSDFLTHKQDDSQHIKLSYSHAMLSCPQGKNLPFKGKCIYIEDVDEIAEHHSFIARGDEMQEFLNFPQEVKAAISFPPETKMTATFSIASNETEQSTLETDWGNLYREGSSLPRKFAINILDMISDGIASSDISSASIVFELQSQNLDCPHNAWSMHLVLCSEHTGISSPKLPVDAFQKIKSESAARFAKCIEMSALGDTLTAVHVPDVVTIGVHCIQEQLPTVGPLGPDITNPRPASYSLNVLESVLGFHCSSFSVDQAYTKITMEIQQKAECYSSSTPPKNPESCGICFEAFEDEGHQFTAMSECKHWFCNACWEIYLKTQIHNGQTDLPCPEHGCGTSIDDVSVMSLVPSWYNKYLSRKIKRNLGRSEEWVRCPSERCKLISKVTPTKRIQERGHGDEGVRDPFPVLCVCGHIWCLSCRELAHWPATCQEAKAFRKQNTAWKLKDEIKFVQVKNCPVCHYPIEKHLGCSHMFCIMCSTYFCWVCLQVDKSHDINYCSQAKHRKVEIPKLIQGELNFVDVAWQNRSARTAVSMLKVQQKLDSIQRGLDSYHTFCALLSAGKLRLKKGTKPSNVVTILDSMAQNNAHKILKRVYNFKFQAHIVVEGVAMVLAANKKEKKLRENFYKMMFMMDQVNIILSDNRKIHKSTSLERLDSLVVNAQSDVFAISKGTLKVEGKYYKLCS